MMDGPTDLARQPAPSTQNAASSRQNIEVPRTPARAQLALAIAELTRAGAELAAAQEPATRLGAVIAETARLKAQVAVLRAADEARLGAWLAGAGTDPRPEPSAATIAAEKQLEVLADDAAAAQAALPAAEQSFQHSAERVREVQRRRDAAPCGAAVEAAHGFAERYRAALTVALEHEAVLHGLRNELLLSGNRSDAEPGAMDAAARIGELIAEAKRAAAVRRNPEAGRRLLGALLSDPNADL
jgi:hypothetical protein